MSSIHPAGLSSLHDVLRSAADPAATPASQLNAFCTAAGVFSGAARVVIACSGEDRVRWLNGMVTNHVGELAAHRGGYAFVLNAQGRIQGDLNIYPMGDALWLETAAAQADKLQAYLDHYIIMDDVTLARLPAQQCIGLAGPAAATTLAEIGIQVADMEPLSIRATTWADVPIVVTAEYSPLVPRYALWITPENAAACAQALLAAGAIACDADAVEHLRILEGTPIYGIDINDRDLPQETGLARALHFSKGCYLGQEIVERIRSRGNVHRIFSGFLFEDSSPLPSPAQGERLPILADGQSVGEITSAAQIRLSSGDKKNIALGYIRREALEKKIELSCNARALHPEKIPMTTIFEESRIAQ